MGLMQCLHSSSSQGHFSGQTYHHVSLLGFLRLLLHFAAFDDPVDPESMDSGHYGLYSASGNHQDYDYTLEEVEPVLPVLENSFLTS